MTVKSKKSATPPDTIKYPWLGVIVDDGNRKDSIFVVLFTCEGYGTVVYTEPQAEWDLGHYNNDWRMDSFVAFSDKLTLQNE